MVKTPKTRSSAASPASSKATNPRGSKTAARSDSQVTRTGRSQSNVLVMTPPRRSTSPMHRGISNSPISVDAASPLVIPPTKVRTVMVDARRGPKKSVAKKVSGLKPMLFEVKDIGDMLREAGQKKKNVKKTIMFVVDILDKIQRGESVSASEARKAKNALAQLFPF